MSRARASKNERERASERERVDQHTLLVMTGSLQPYWQLHSKVMQMMYDNGGNINAQNRNGDTPLMRACAKNPSVPELITWLLDRKADPNICNQYVESFCK
jgi:hypothetical protein